MARTTYRPENVILAGLLRTLREDAGLTQAEVGKRLGRAQSFVSDYEAGQRRLDLVELFDLGKALDVPLGEIVERFSLLVAHTPKRRRGATRS